MTLLSSERKKQGLDYAFIEESAYVLRKTQVKLICYIKESPPMP